MSRPDGSALRRALPGLLLALLLPGCAIGPDYQRPKIDLPPAYPHAFDSDTQDAEQGRVAQQWWTLYGDATLNDLVTLTLKNNADLRMALAQIDEAEAILAETGANLLPEIDLDASNTKARTSSLTAQPLPPGTPLLTRSSRITLSTAFELDLWGKLRRATQSARAQVLSSRYARDVTALTLAGTTARTYFTLRALDTQIAVTRETLASRDESLQVVKNRARGGLASDLDVYQAQGVRSDAALQLSELQRQRALVEHQLGSLTGTLDLKIDAGDVMSLGLPALPGAGLPASLLERRPDVQQAEQDLIAANAQIGVAKAALLPTFSLSGSYGGHSEKSKNLYEEGARIWSAGPSVHLPIFDAGKYRARTRQAEARQRLSAAAYQKAVETAFREVADALANLEHTSAAVEDTLTKVNAARNALRLSRLRYETGYSAYLDVLDAQRSANAAELALVQNRQALLSYSIDLMKALGGGWSPSRDAAQAQR
jgi:multidrug efflux system outer membrane protein